MSFVSLPVFSSCLGLVNLSQVHDLEWVWYGHMQVGYHYGHHHLCSGHEFPPVIYLTISFLYLSVKQSMVLRKSLEDQI